MKVNKRDLILAFYPHARGFSYIIFEGALAPVDWGMSDVPFKAKAAACLRRLEILLDQYRPDALLLREMPHGRGKGAFAELLGTMSELAKSRGVTIAMVSRKHIREAFAYLGSPSRYAIVEAIAARIPLLATYVPPKRKIWNGEDRRMGLFDAAALALTFAKQRMPSAL
jgi:hypothetical protein